MSLKNNQGFSLIELMVVVAIIAILATIAVPSYNNFQAKARQKEGIALLNGYYTAAQATFAEMGFYAGDFVAVGFQPTGQLGYRVTAVDGPAPTYGAHEDACVATNVACTTANFVTWTERNAGSVGAALGPVTQAGAANTVTAFVTTAGGVISTGAAAADGWTINQQKFLSNNSPGLY